MNIKIDNIFDDVDYNFLKIIAKSASLNNIRLFIVGGAVRDYFLGKKIKDIDLIVDKSAISFIKKIQNDEIQIKSIHNDFDTIKVIFQNKVYDIASTRSEKYPYSGALPVVEKIGIDIKSDYLRRDFTINSIYIEVAENNNELNFEVFDYSNGISDIKNKTLKVLHKNSYIDDPTRILRGIDFKFRFDFDFSDDDKNLIKKYLKNINLENASIDRIESVFKMILNNKNADKIFDYAVENEIYFLLNQKKLDINKAKIIEICKIFGFDYGKKAKFYFKIFKNNQVSKLNLKTNFEIYCAFKKLDDTDIAYYYYKTDDYNVINYLKIKDVKLKITGKDLINLNFCKGKIFSEILNSLLSYELDIKAQRGSSLTKSDEIDWVKKNFNCNQI